MILLSFLVALSFKAQATPLIVEEVVDRKATVYVPPNVTVKPGDQLFTEMPVPQTAANPLSVSQTALPPDSQSTESAMKTLRKRTHNVFFDYSNQELNWELKSPANLKLKGEESNVSIAYGYNYGYFEIWGQIAAAKINNSDLKGTTSGVGITINAIENVPGNNVIPYATIGIGYHNEDREINGQDYNAQGNISFFGVGIKWYPLGEIFAIKLSLEKVLADLSISSTILSDDVNSNYELEGLHVGYIFSF